MSELVSILIPAYNAEKWIAYTINSALAQTWPHKEIIIVDDGSTDNTFVIAKQCESASVKVISQENKGASAARNKAFLFAQGNYIQWLDADDLLAPNKVSEQMKLADLDPTSTTLCSGPHGVFYWRPEKAKFVPNSLWQDLNPVDWMIAKFSENLWMLPAGWLVSRVLTEKVGPWDERLSLDDDGEYFSRIVTKSEGVKFVPEARCYYRQSSFSQLSRKVSEEAGRSLLSSLTLSIRYLMALEDSVRTRRASLAFLQISLPVFYPEENELLEEISKLAFDLGGELMPPKLGLRLAALQGAFGPKRGKELMTAFRKIRLAAKVKWDEMLYRFDHGLEDSRPC